MNKHIESLRLHEEEGQDLRRVWTLGLFMVVSLCCWFWLTEPETADAFVEEEAVLFEAPGKGAEASGGGY